MTDNAFLGNLLSDPKNDAPRLVYADWLEDRGDPDALAKAEFLRLTVQLVAEPGNADWQQRLQELAVNLDTDWLAVVSRMPVEICPKKRLQRGPRRPLGVIFEYQCHRRWEDLRPTGFEAVRTCPDCKEQVYYCDTIMKARDHAWADHCIAVDLGVIRRDDDLQPARMYLGRPSPALLRAENERMQPDPVSAERQRRKEAAKR